MSENDDKMGPLPLRQLRTSLGVTQKELALRLGVSQAAVCCLETRGSPNLNNLVRYLNALEVDVRIQAVFPDKEPFVLLESKHAPRNDP